MGEKVGLFRVGQEHFGPTALRDKVHLGCGLVELDAVNLIMINRITLKRFYSAFWGLVYALLC